MKLDLTKALLIAALIFIGWQNFFYKVPEAKPVEVSVTIPEVSGSSDVIQVKPDVIRDTIYLKGSVVEVDKGYKELYEKAKDSLDKKNLFLDAIRITKTPLLFDNEDITISGTATNRGELLNYSLNYTIKEKTFSYTPEVETKFPNLSVGFGVEVGTNVVTLDNFTARANIHLMNSKGKVINVGLDTDTNVWIGYTKFFKIFK